MLQTGEVKSFISIKKAAKFVSIDYSYLVKIIKTHEIYIGKIYTITKNNTIYFFYLSCNFD